MHFLQTAGASLVMKLGTQHAWPVVPDKGAHSGVIIVCPAQAASLCACLEAFQSLWLAWIEFTDHEVSGVCFGIHVSLSLLPREEVFEFSSPKCILCLASSKCSWSYYFLPPCLKSQRSFTWYFCPSCLQVFLNWNHE